MMRLLILTQYYPPEIGAPQNRLHELAVRLKKQGIHVEVLTALPNYPIMEVHQEYLNKKNREEIIDEIEVHRAWIYVSQSRSIVSRLLNYFSFVWSSYWRGRKLQKFDYIMVESPPLFLGYSAMALSRKLKAKMIFNVSDLWPESAKKLGLVTNNILLKLAYKLEEKCYKRAAMVTCQTQGIVNDIQLRFPFVNTFFLPNGVDLEYYNPANIQPNGYRQKHGFSKDQKLFFYGGIVGHAQGLEVILHAAVSFKNESTVQFIIQGSGPEKDKLIALKNELSLNNVHFLNPVTKQEMPYVLKEIDVAIVPLRKLKLFEGAIPSKIFETLAMEIPILLAVDGESREHFVNRANAAFFIEPENVEDLTAKIKTILLNDSLSPTMGKNGRAYANKHFNRNNIAKNLIEKLNELLT